MTTWNDAFDTGKGTLYLDVTETSTNSSTNTSVVSFTLRVTGNTTSWNLNSGSTWSVVIDGTTYSGTWTYDFRSDNTVTLKTGTKTITHAADGSKSISVSGTAYGNSTIGTATITSKSFTLTDFTVLPSAPASPALTRSSTGSSITAVGAVASSPVSISNYDLRWSYDNATWTTVTDIGTDRTQTLTVTSTATVYAQTRGISSEGDGPWSSSASVVGVPTAPASISISRTGRNVTVTSGSATGSGITGYKVQFNDGSGWSTAVAMTSQTHTYSNLDGATTYTFRVYASNAIGDSAYTTSGSLFVPAGGKRYNGTAFVDAATAKRWNGSAWEEITTAKRWSGSAWTDLS